MTLFSTNTAQAGSYQMILIASLASYPTVTTSATFTANLINLQSTT